MNRLGLAVVPSEQSHPAPGAHPERYERLALALNALEKPAIEELTARFAVRSYDLDLLTKIHTSEHIDRLRRYQEPGHDYLDPDTYRVGSSFAASCDVTWALLSGVDEAFSGLIRASFVIGRPPGHHAETNRAMGFCLVNHVAVAAQHALDAHGCERVAVVDFDVHHGNGTQEIFYRRDDVLYISTHQYPFYPGSGSRDERGRGPGEGFTVNHPLAAGVEDDDLVALFQGEVQERLRSFRPGLILVSAGFDGHRSDPLGGFDLTGDGYRRIAELLKRTADETCQGRIISLFEGGYDPRANVDSITNYIKGLAE